MRRHAHVGLQLAGWRTVFFFHTELELGWQVGLQRAITPFPYYAGAVRKLGYRRLGNRGCQSSTLPTRIIASKSYALYFGCLQISHQRPWKTVLVHNVSKNLILARRHCWEFVNKCTIRRAIGVKMPHSLQARLADEKQVHEMAVVGNQIIHLDFIR